MSIQLPKPIATFFQHRAEENPEGAATLFTPDATVIDQGEDHEITGREAIHHWLAQVGAQYKTTVEIVGLTEETGEHVVTTLVSGNFPGSPAEFAYRFTLSQSLIQRLVIEFVGFK